MNNFLKFFGLIVLSIIFLNCKSTDDPIKISQYNTDSEIIIRLTLEDTSVIGIKFPNKIQLSNNSIFEKSLVKIEYNYNNIPSEMKKEDLLQELWYKSF